MTDGYLELKLSWELYRRGPETLAAEEKGRLAQVASNQRKIEARILGTPEAAGVMIPQATLMARLDEIRRRYEDAAALDADLERLGLSRDDLAAAVTRDLHVEAVLERVAAAVEPASQIDAEIYYRLHPDAFNRPEMRGMRHILVTWTTPAERTAAAVLLANLRPSLATADDFAAAALRHSHCPTAVEGGMLGTVKPGQLYPELEPVAFALAEATVSEPSESPIGLHLLRCDHIHPAQHLEFSEVRERIVEKLGDQRRRDRQREWVKSLLQG
ncbi:MAG: nitrogen fixation protein NifM [Azonexus sp.]